MTKKRVIYGESNYAALVREHGYFVDKTEYIAKLEQVKNPVFLRPRRFCKSMFCSILRHYYDLNQADHFVEPQGEALYNSTILIYFLSYFTQYGVFPKQLIDPNLKVDLSWVRRLTGANPQLTAAFVDQLTLENQIRSADKKAAVSV